jgi:class 3 adenylate cyclase
VAANGDGADDSSLQGTAVRVSLVAAAYFATAWLGLELHSTVSASITSFWAPAGVAVAAALLWGRWMFFGVYLGAMAINGATAAGWGVAPIIGVGNTAEAVIISEALSRFFPLPGTVEMNRFLDELAFAGSLLVGCAVAAAVGASVIVAHAEGNWLQAFGTWWTGDLAGVLIVTPAILLVAALGRHGGVRVESEESHRERGGHHWFLGDQDALLDEIQHLLTGAPQVRGLDRVLATVMFTDIVGSTERAAELGDERWRELLASYEAIVRAQLERFRGREVKMLGDGVLATFDAPARAIRCARVICEEVRGLGIQVRVGLHTGECEMRHGDIGGIAVHTGARVSAKAASGEVLVSNTVKDLVAGSGIEFEDRGVHRLKGVPGEWRLFAVY